MSNDLPAWKYITENATAIPKDPSVQDGYVLLLVLVSVFIGGTLVLLSGILIICRRCCETDRRYSRANDDPEKTNTTYLEESQPTQEITIKVDDSECLSTGSYHDLEAERFLSTGSTGRRVSFNEASLFDHGKKTQEKGRRYTLTEGDFHHLKNARLTHLHISPPSLKIVTIHECESSENNSLAMTTQAPSSSKTNLSIFQSIINPLPQTALTSHSVNPSSALPGDTFNSSVNTTFVDANVPTPADSGESSMTEGLAGSTKGGSSSSNAIEAVTAPNQGPVLQFFTKLRRNASLESASPYFKIKKWKFETSQRALSLDTRGSPKRHQFHRQRAASESMEHEDQDPHQTDIIQYIAHTDDVTFGTASTPFAQPPSSPPPSAGRLDAAENLPNGSESTERRESSDQQRICRDIWNLRASLELYISSEQSSNDKDSERSDAESVCSVGGDLLGTFSQDTADEADDLEETTGSKRLKQESVESERGSDSETNARKLLQMDSGYASIEAPSRALEERVPKGDSERGTQDTTASEKRRFFTSSGRKGTVFESYDAKPLSEEFEEEGAVGGEPIDWSPYGQMFVTRDYLHRRDYSIDEKSDALFNEFLRHDPQFDDSPLKSKHRSRIHLRKQWQRTKQYSDPGIRYPPALERHRNPLRRGDSVNYPLDHRYQSTLPRIISATDEEPSESGQEHIKSPTSKHSEAEPSGSETTGVDPEARIQIIEEETAEQGNASDQTEQPDHTDFPQSLGQISGFTETNRPTDFAYGPQMIGADPIDKLTTSIEDRLYTNLKKSKESVDCVVVTVTHASPDHSPV